MNPNYKEYTLIELYDVKDNIDKDLYPERYKLLLSVIKIKEQNPEDEPKPSKLDKKDKESIAKAVMALCAIYLLWALINAFVNGTIRTKSGYIYHLSSQPQGFYTVVFIHIVLVIAALCIVFKDFGNKIVNNKDT